MPSLPAVPTDPIFSSQGSESIIIILPISEEIHRSVQSSLEDGPAGGRVKLTYGSNCLAPDFIRSQVIDVTIPNVSLLEHTLTIFQMTDRCINHSNNMLKEVSCKYKALTLVNRSSAGGKAVFAAILSYAKQNI